MYDKPLSMVQELNVTEARRRLPRLLHDLERHPDHVFRIRVRHRCVAELKAPAQVARPGLAAKRMLALARSAKGRPGARRVSEDVDSALYGD